MNTLKEPLNKRQLLKHIENITVEFDNVDNFYKGCYVKAILELIAENHQIKGFTLDETFKDIQTNDGLKILGRFQTGEVLQRKIIQSNNSVFSFEWNENGEKHMWKCVITDIINLLNIAYNQGLFEIIIDFSNDEIKISIQPITNTHNILQNNLINDLNYHSFNITYLDKLHLQSKNINVWRKEIKDKIKNYILTNIKIQEFETLTVNKHSIRHISLDAECLGSINRDDIINSLRTIIQKSIEQKYNIYKKFKKSKNIIDMIFENKPHYNIENLTSKINFHKETNFLMLILIMN